MVCIQVTESLSVGDANRADEGNAQPVRADCKPTRLEERGSVVVPLFYGRSSVGELHPDGHGSGCGSIKPFAGTHTLSTYHAHPPAQKTQTRAIAGRVKSTCYLESRGTQGKNSLYRHPTPQRRKSSRGPSYALLWSPLLFCVIPFEIAPRANAR